MLVSRRYRLLERPFGLTWAVLSAVRLILWPAIIRPATVRTNRFPIHSLPHHLRSNTFDFLFLNTVRCNKCSLLTLETSTGKVIQKSIFPYFSAPCKRNTIELSAILSNIAFVGCIRLIYNQYFSLLLVML